MALLEAALCGVPMVTFAVGGNSEIVMDGRNGRLVPAFDLDALITAAEGLIDPAVACRMAASTRDDATRRLGVESVGDRMIRALTDFAEPA